MCVGKAPRGFGLLSLVWMYEGAAEKHRCVGMQAVPDLTSKRVLTMEYMDGVSVNNLQGLADMGADPAEVRTSASLRIVHIWHALRLHACRAR